MYIDQVENLMNKQMCLVVKGSLALVGVVLAIWITVEALELVIDHTLK